MERAGMIENFSPDFAGPSEWAMMYRLRGIQVVPAHAYDPKRPGNQWKRPLLPEWRSYCGEIVPQFTFLRWYGPNGEHEFRPNMGIITGTCSGNIGVVDLDTQKTPAAAYWWQALLQEHNSNIEPETWQQVTGGGGRQLLFRFPPTFRIPTNRTAIGVDIRGQGGFAMLPPSKHESGKEYDWVKGCAPNDIEIADAPLWLCQAIVDLVGEHSGDEPRERTASSADYDAFGFQIDGREEKMANLVWARLIDLRRNGIDPDDAQMRDAFEAYARSVKTRIPGIENAAGLEREGRGWTEFQKKWRETIHNKWGGEIADEAAKAPRQEEPPPAAQAGRFKFEKVADLRTLPPVQWLVDKWIPERSIGLFYGKWAAGKSFIGFDLTLHLAYGMTDWHGIKLPGMAMPVLIIAREGHGGFVKRVDAFQKHYGLADDPEDMRFMRGSVSFMNDQDFVDLCADIKATGIQFGLVLIDTVARAVPGVDINEPEVGTLFMERCQAIGELTGAAVIGVHHQNKSGAMMGSVFFEANSDFIFEVSREGEDGPLEAGEIRCTKQKDGEDGWKLPVAYKKIALNPITDEGSLVVHRIGGPDGPKKSGLPDREVCDRIKNALREAWLKKLPWSPFPQTKNEGRFAVDNIVREFRIKRSVAEMLIQEWQRNGILRVEICDQHSKMKGLKVLG